MMDITLLLKILEKIYQVDKRKEFVARALFRNPEILVLDEITSSLDEKMKKKYSRVFSKL